MSVSPRRLLPAIVGAALLVTALAVPAAAGSGTTRYVDDDGKVGPNGCDGTSITRGRIQRAVNQSAAGDTVRVCPGTYPEDVLVTKNRLTIVAVKAHTAIVTRPVMTAAGRGVAGGSPVPEDALITVDGADGVTIRGLRLVAAAPDLTPVGFGCGIPAMISVTRDANGARVLGNRIGTEGPNTLDGCGYGDGIVFSDASGGRAQGNVVTNFSGVGIRALGEGTTLSVRANTIRFWHKQESPTGPVGGSVEFNCWYGAGIVLEAGAVGSILGNQVLGLKSAGYSTPLICPGIYLQDAGDGVSVVENRVTHAFDAINTQGTDAWTIIGNRFVDTRNDALLVLASRRGVAEDNRINGTIGRGIIVEGGDGPPVAVAAYPGIAPTGVVASRNNVFRDNTSIDNFGRDCVDQTTGTRTKGTANTWVRNEGDGNDQPNGLCPVR